MAKADTVEVEIGKLLDRDPQPSCQSQQERGRGVHVLLALVCDVLFCGQGKDRAHVVRETHDPRDCHRERRALEVALVRCTLGENGRSRDLRI